MLKWKKEKKMVINENIAELAGAISGDGNIYRKFNKYRIGFSGHSITDKLYFQYLQNLIKKEWKKDSKIIQRERGIQMTINSKEVCLFLIDDLKMPYGKKSDKIFIPEKIINDWQLTKKFIRGIVDTDGTVFAVRKPRVEKYPAIEITTISQMLAEQLKNILEKNGFGVSKIWRFISKPAETETYRLGLYGQKNLDLWIKEIGFSNPYKLERALSYVKNHQLMERSDKSGS